ncbi:MAG: 2-C-methyl-D-erythritol 4-phosphate cytidylyltransferase [Rothia sp. (in: high G+C Gram-positive bacteria)]|nr:2-C-methyl-D-erythritol 4-phosphate cytidylyltransferase [Rothia sp. (in: high G+C Gram-positive bacteria)]
MESNNFSTTATATNAIARSGVAVVVVAAGSGSRLGYGVPKAQVKIAGKELLRWALEGVQASGVAARVVVTVPEGDTLLSSIASEFGALAVTGGSTRAESVVSALARIPDAVAQPGFADSAPSVVLVHDAARCFTPAEVFSRVVEAVEAKNDAVIPVMPVVDTIKSVDELNFVSGTPARANLRAVQTPQGFNLKILNDAYTQAAAQGLAESITDDAMLAEILQIPVLTVEGSADSFKITTPLDVALAKALYEKDTL